MKKHLTFNLTAALWALAFIACGGGNKGGGTVSVTGVTVSPKTVTITIDGARQLNHAIAPGNATNKNVSWISSRPNIADVSPTGLVTGKALGDARITAATADGNKMDYCDVTVGIPVTGVTVTPITTSIPVNGAQQLTATIAPADATNKNVIWTSSSANVTIAPNGLVATVTGVTPGPATITVATVDGNHTNTCSVAVTAAPAEVAVTGVTVAPITASIPVNGAQQLTATVLPADAANKAVTWTSSNNAIATVSPTGLVTALAPGEATITATTADGGHTGNCSVAVTAVSVTVYIAGFERYVQAGLTYSTLWVNGVPQRLTNGTTATSTVSCFVKDGKRYVAGREYNAQYKTVATLWVDGVPQRLGDGIADSDTRDVFVSGGKVYVSGCERNAQNRYVATLWTDGVPQRLGDENALGSDANSVFVSDGKVYVAGYERNAQNHYSVMVWVDGVAGRITDESSQATAYGIFVSDGKVYVAGEEAGENNLGAIATLWVNGVPQRLSERWDQPGYAYSVFVSDGKVYVAGQEENAQGFDVATLWVNGVPQRLSDGTRFATTNNVFVCGDDVYVAGYDDMGNIPILWVNGVPEIFGDGTTSIYLNHVFVESGL